MSAAIPNASSASSALPPRWLAIPSSSSTSARAARALDPQLERGAQPRRRLVERERGDRRPRGEHVVVDAALGAAERRRGGEMVCEVGESAAGAPVGALERLADAQVQLRPAHPGQPVVQRATHQLVREPVRQRARRQLLDHPAVDRLVEAGEELGVRDAQPRGGRRRARTPRRRWPPARAGRWSRAPAAKAAGRRPRCTLSGRAELRRRPGQPDRPVDDLDACRSPSARATARRRGTRFPRSGRRSPARAPAPGLAPRRRADELGDLVAG